MRVTQMDPEGRPTACWEAGAYEVTGGYLHLFGSVREIGADGIEPHPSIATKRVKAVLIPMNRVYTFVVESEPGEM